MPTKKKQGIVTKLRWLRGFTSVDLSDNNIDDASTQPLKNLLALRQLRRLNLRGNDLGPAAAKALIESLPRCRGLQVVETRSCAVLYFTIVVDSLASEIELFGIHRTKGGGQSLPHRTLPRTGYPECMLRSRQTASGNRRSHRDHPVLPCVRCSDWRLTLSSPEPRAPELTSRPA